MHVLDLIYCLFQFFSASPRFASSFRKRASVSTSLKMIQKTYSRNNSQTSSNPPGLFQLLQCPPGSAEPRKGPACGSGARGGSRDRDRAPLGRRDGHGSSSVPRATQPFRRVPKALILTSQSSSTSIQPTPYTFCGSWPKYPGAAQPFPTLIFSLFFSVFQCFVVHTDYPIMKYNLYIKPCLP